MLLALEPILDVAADAELLVEDRPVRWIGPVLAHLHFAGDHVDADAADARGGPGEVLVDEVLIEAERLEDLGAVVALYGADAHLRDDLHDALGDGLAVLLLGYLGGAGDHAQADLVVDRLEGEVGVDRAGSVAEKHGEVVHLTRLAGFQDQADLGAGSRPHEVVMDGRNGEERGDGGIVGVMAAVGQDDDVVALGDSLGASIAQLLDGLAQARSAVRDVEERRQRDRLEPVRVSVSRPLARRIPGSQAADLLQLVVRENG